MLCGLKTILTDMNILNSYRHIRPKKVKYPIPEIPDDSGKKSGTDWVLPKIIGSGRVSGTRQALLLVQEPYKLKRRQTNWQTITTWLFDRKCLFVHNLDCVSSQPFRLPLTSCYKSFTDHTVSIVFQNKTSG